MTQFLVDSNVILDVVTEDKTWFDWSARMLENCASRGRLCINPLIYSEVSVGFDRVEEVDDVLSPSDFSRLPLPWEAAFLAGKAFVDYRRAKGTRRSPLPDFSSARMPPSPTFRY
jgi:predicted nucleic acid-binding protein